MRELLAVGLCVLAGCSGGGVASNHDPVRYGTVRVAVQNDPANTEAWAEVVDALDALGPDFALVASTDPAADVTVALGVDLQNVFIGCGVVFDRTAKLLQVSARCPTTDVELQTIVRHSLEHWVGMAHVAAPALIQGTNRGYALRGAGADAEESWGIPAGATFDEFPAGQWATQVTQADVDEFRRTHP
jgi:hypothetical protein